MPTTVYFASNRVLTGDASQVSSYSAGLQTPSEGEGIVYGSAFVDAIDVASNTQGVIDSIQETRGGALSRQRRGRSGRWRPQSPDFHPRLRQ